MRYKPLGDVTAKHRRNKDRKTGKLRIPDEIQLEADSVMESGRTAPPASVLTTIGEFVADYLKDREKELKVPTYKGYVRLWEKAAYRPVVRSVGTVLVRSSRPPSAEPAPTVFCNHRFQDIDPASCWCTCRISMKPYEGMKLLMPNGVELWCNHYGLVDSSA